MRRNLRSCLVFSAFLVGASLSAQTAADVLAKHETAIGGKDLISQVKSISMQTTTHMANNDMPGSVVVLDGVLYRAEVNFSGGNMVQCYTARGGWMVNPMAGMNDPTPMPDDQYQAGRNEIYVGGDLHDYAAAGNKLDLLAKDADAYTIKLTTKEKTETTFVIDSATYMIKSVTRKGNLQGQEMNITTTLSDYRKTDVGLMVPYAISVDFGGQFSFNITVDKVEINKTIDPATCDMPKSSQSPPASKATPN